MLDVTHLPDLGHTACAARDLSFLRVTTDYSESLATFRSLAQFSHHTDSPSSASSRVDSQVAGPSRDAEVDPKFQQTSAKKSSGNKRSTWVR